MCLVRSDSSQGYSHLQSLGTVSSERLIKVSHQTLGFGLVFCAQMREAACDAYRASGVCMVWHKEPILHDVSEC